MADAITEIKKLLKEDKIVMGKDLTLKGLRAGRISKVYLAKNCSEDLKQDVMHYAEISGTEVEQLTISNSELGDACKRPHFISVMGAKK